MPNATATRISQINGNLLLQWRSFPAAKGTRSIRVECKLELFRLFRLTLIENPAVESFVGRNNCR